MIEEKPLAEKDRRKQRGFYIGPQHLKQCSVFSFFKTPDYLDSKITRALNLVIPAKLQFGHTDLLPRERNMGLLSIYNRLYKVASRELDFLKGTLRCSLVSFSDPTEILMPPEGSIELLNSYADAKNRELVELLRLVQKMVAFLSQVNHLKMGS